MAPFVGSGCMVYLFIYAESIGIITGIDEKLVYLPIDGGMGWELLFLQRQNVGYCKMSCM